MILPSREESIFNKRARAGDAMPEQRSLSLDEVAATLKTGVTTLNVWRKRYGRWMPDPVDREGRLFPDKILDLFRLISRCTQVGMDPQDIERVLGAPGASQHHGPETHSEPTHAMIDALKETVAGLTVQQQRIAEAQERRALAEERKAFAMESQAEAELIKAHALKDITRILQDMSVKDPVSALMDRVRSMPGPAPTELDDFTSDHGYAPEQLENLSDISDLSDYVDQPGEALPPDSLPVDSVDLPRIEPDEPLLSDVNVDDLSLLIEDEEQRSETTEPVDDLSLLLEADDAVDRSDIDDLSQLIDEEPRTVASEEKPEPDRSVDNLSLLLDEDEPSKATPQPVRPSAPVDEQYKSTILKRIIQMKQKDHLSVEDVTRRFNEEGVKTLSGKGSWDSKTIQGIYRYIDSVQGG